jgi:hypothetical protein
MCAYELFLSNCKRWIAVYVNSDSVFIFQLSNLQCFNEKDIAFQMNMFMQVILKLLYLCFFPYMPVKTIFYLHSKNLSLLL